MNLPIRPKNFYKSIVGSFDNLVQLIGTWLIMIILHRFPEQDQNIWDCLRNRKVALLLGKQLEMADNSVLIYIILLLFGFVIFSGK